MKNIIETMKSWFKPNKESLRREAIARAEERFNIIKEDGLTYIVYNGIKVSPKRYGNADQELLTTLYELREMYVDLYVEREGRL